MQKKQVGSCGPVVACWTQLIVGRSILLWGKFHEKLISSLSCLWPDLAFKVQNVALNTKF